MVYKSEVALIHPLWEVVVVVGRTQLNYIRIVALTVGGLYSGDLLNWISRGGLLCCTCVGDFCQAGFSVILVNWIFHLMLSLADLKKFGGGRHIITYDYEKSSSCRIQKLGPKSVLPALTMLTVWCSTLKDCIWLMHWFKNCIPDDWASQCDSSGVRTQLEDIAPPCPGLYTGNPCTGLYTGIFCGWYS